MNITSGKNKNGTVKYEFRSDGVYLTVSPEKNKAVEYSEIMDVINQNGIQDCDFVVISQLCKSTATETLKVSSNTRVKSVDESVSVSIERDKMSASIIFHKEVNGGKKITLGALELALQNAGVIACIDTEELNRLIERRSYEIPYVVAKGIPPVHGKDAYLEYHFDTQKKSLKPKVLDDGKIDYRNLDLIELARKDQPLITMVPATEGSMGKNVLGGDITFSPGKKVKLPVGKNVRISDDGLQLLSNIDGQIQYLETKINVLSIYEVAGNVDNSTGNIQFLGSVIVRGNVLSGFSIVATGFIQVQGVVEGASLHSESDIIISGGIQGIGKARLIAGGRITAKFIENSHVRANKDIEADAIMHSNIWCGGKLVVEGRKGLIVGGKIRVAEEVHAMIIGSSMATATEIEVGLSLELFEKYNSIKKDLAAIKIELENNDKIIDVLMKMKNANQLTDDKKAILIRSIRTKSYALEKAESLQHELDEIVPRLETGLGKIKVQKLIHSGVRILIGNAIMHVREEIKFCTIYNKDGEIKVGSYA